MDRYYRRCADCRRMNLSQSPGCGCGSSQSSGCGSSQSFGRPGCSCGFSQASERSGCSCGSSQTSERPGCSCGSSQTSERSGCSCGQESAASYNICRPGSAPSEQNAMVGIGYVPWQQWECTYPLDRALFSGTIFPSLDKPFLIGRCAVRS